MSKTMTPNEQLARIAALEQQVEEQKAINEAQRKASEKAISLKVSAKGAVSVYGMGRFPFTLYAEQWERLLAMAPAILGFIEVNRKSGRLISKAERQEREAKAATPSSSAIAAVRSGAL